MMDVDVAIDNGGVIGCCQHQGTAIWTKGNGIIINDKSRQRRMEVILLRSLTTAFVESFSTIAKGPQQKYTTDSTPNVGLVIVKVGGSTLIEILNCPARNLHGD
jgi:hypothetical protein